MTLDIIGRLAAPFPPESVHWRAQVVSVKDDKAKALAVPYIDARDVMDRLDTVVGPENWQTHFNETLKGRVICTLSVRIGGEWVAKSDGAGDTDVEGEKGAISDALKRAAVSWGIGRYLYSMPPVWVPCKYRKNGQKNQFVDWERSPWNYVRSSAYKPQPEAAQANDGQAANEWLKGFMNCQTLKELQSYWTKHWSAISAHAEVHQITAAKDQRKAAIAAMDTVSS